MQVKSSYKGIIMLYEYLMTNYNPNEPIFISDINLPISNGNLRKKIKELCDAGKVKRFDTGIYYLPKKSRLKGDIPLSVDTVANGNTVEYYSGYTFANQLGVTMQVPYVIEIVSNNASAKVREVSLQGRRIVLRKSRIPVTKENYIVLQFLDFLKDADQYADDNNDDLCLRIRKYIIDEKIKKSDVDLYIKQYPDKIYRNIYEMGLYDVLA